MAIETLSDANFKDTLNENEKTIVMYFADWCGSCRLFKPKFKRLSNDERYASVTFVNINAEENPESRHMAGVDNLPFFAIFDKGNKVEGISTSKEEVVVGLIEKLS